MVGGTTHHAAEDIMRYSEMIAREKTHARQNGELPGNVRDLRQHRHLWLITLLALIALYFLI